MTEYFVMLPGDEAAWEAATEEFRQGVFARHREFQQLLAERGHTMTGGAELTPSRQAKVVRTDADGSATVTDGPYAETVEQVTGIYIIESDDLDDLIEVCKVLGRGEGAIEIRAAAGGGSSA